MWVRGDALLLGEDGRLLGAEFWWEQARDTAGKYPVFRDIAEASSGLLLQYDYADRGRWEKQRPPQGQQYAESFRRSYVLAAHAKGVGASVALKRLLETGGQPFDIMVYSR